MSDTRDDCRGGVPRPARADLLVGLLTLVAALLPFVVGRHSEMLMIQPRWTLVGLAVLGSVALIWRRQHPWLVWAGATCLGLVAVGAGGGPTTAYVPAVVALFSVSSRARITRAGAAAVVSGLSPVAVIVSVGRDGAFDSLAFGMTAWSGIALMSGIAVRNSRAVVAAAHERARLAEHSREEEAQRRVTEERFRIARELHDVMAHHVSVINVQAGVAGHLVYTDPERAAAAMTHVREASQSVLQEVSSILGLLRSGEEGLVTAPAVRFAEIDGLVEQTRHSGTQVVWQTSGMPCELTPVVDLTAYRVVQEALTNATRHGTGSIDVQVLFDADELELVIRNRRAPGAAAVTSRAQHGLTGMRERAEAVGGTLTVGPDRAGGWEVSARLPLERRAVDEPEASVR